MIQNFYNIVKVHLIHHFIFLFETPSPGLPFLVTQIIHAQLLNHKATLCTNLSSKQSSTKIFKLLYYPNEWMHSSRRKPKQYGIPHGQNCSRMFHTIYDMQTSVTPKKQTMSFHYQKLEENRDEKLKTL